MNPIRHLVPLALLFAWLGAHFARRPADARRSFGYARLEVLEARLQAIETA